MECSTNSPVLSLLMKHLVIGQRQKAPNFSAFDWSPHDSLVSIGQHSVTTNINTEIEIEADLNTESDQAMRAVQSCNSWFLYYSRTKFNILSIKHILGCFNVTRVIFLSVYAQCQTFTE